MGRKLRTLAVLLGLATSSVAVAMSPAAAHAVVMCHGLRATIVGTNDRHGDGLVGTPGDDVIAGLAGPDGIQGGGGNDVICGGLGADQLLGGPGNDKLFGGLDTFIRHAGRRIHYGDRLVGGPGDDLLVPGVDRHHADQWYYDEIDWRGGPGIVVHGRAGTAVGQGNDSFVGTRAELILTGHRDVFYGGPHRDRVANAGGADEIYGRGGNDVIEAGCSAIVQGGPGRDNVGEDLCALPAGPAHLVGGPGRDRMVLFREGADASARWNMVTGRVVYNLPLISISLTARGFERGVLLSPHTHWRVRGTAADDWLSLADTAGGSFRALAGNDTLTGSPYDDTFNGGDGTDHSLGMGSGNDTCISVEIYDSNDCEIQQP